MLARALERAKLLERSRTRKRLEVVLEQAQRILIELQNPFQVLQQAADRLPAGVTDPGLAQDLRTIKQETASVKASLEQIGKSPATRPRPILADISILDLDRSAPRPERQENANANKSDPGH